MYDINKIILDNNVLLNLRRIYKSSIMIKQRRVSLNFTEEQVYEKIFISTKSISNWENNKIFLIFKD